MKLFKNTAMVCAVAGLGACSTTAPVAPAPSFTPVITGTAQVDAGGAYSVTQNGSTEVLGRPNGTLTGTSFDAFVASVSGMYGVGYHTTEVTAVAGMHSSVPRATYAGISGTLSTTVPTPPSGTTVSGTFVGRYNASYYRAGTTNRTWWSHGAFTTHVNFSTGALTGSGTGSSGGNLTVSGTLEGAQCNGTANFTALDFPGATNVPMTGGFYGTNDVVGIFQSTQVAGAFYGQ